MKTIKPITVSEQLMFTTVRLECEGFFGTGFFYMFGIDGKKCPLVITNKHVVNGKRNNTVKFSLHLSDNEEEANATRDCIFSLSWFFHPTQDLCFSFVNPLLEKVYQDTGKRVFLKYLYPEMVATEKMRAELSALEEVVMVGYPIGLIDSTNKLPIFRRGYTATHPNVDFDGKKIGLVDMACFPGSSGSPILILNEDGYRDKRGNVYVGAQRLLLLGIQYAVPNYNAEGKLVNDPNVTKDRFTVQTQTMTNLGYYIKADEIFGFDKIIRNVLSSQSNAEQQDN